ncbi:hypothetical protein, partial [Neisseria iguanae]|uniref:hypothetical protein n=1 Tax=Neisseria iguanae TaxID=90242 RepID=UPI001B802FFB
MIVAGSAPSSSKLSVFNVPEKPYRRIAPAMMAVLLNNGHRNRQMPSFPCKRESGSAGTETCKKLLETNVPDSRLHRNDGFQVSDGMGESVLIFKSNSYIFPSRFRLITSRPIKYPPGQRGCPFALSGICTSILPSGLRPEEQAAIPRLDTISAAGTVCRPYIQTRPHR